MTATLTNRAAVECLGTFLLTFSVGCNVLYEAHYNAALSIGVTLMVLVFAFGKVSGAHFNPAVTLAVSMVVPENEFPKKDVPVYWASQLTGAVLASLTLHGMVGKFLNPIAPGHSHTWVHAGNGEFVFTAMLCSVILLTAVPTNFTRGKEYAGLAIGFALTAGVYAGAHISGAAFNPAIALACDIVHLFDHGFWSFVWVAYQMAGAIVAAQTYKYMTSDDKQGANMLSEFMGTFFFVFTCLCAGDANIAGYAGFAVATALAALVFAYGSISGGHLNPAVTMAIMCSGRKKMNASDGAKYMFCQFLGAAAAGGLSVWTLGEASHITLWSNHSIWATLFVETLFTAKLAFVVLTVATANKTLDNFFGLAIGFCVFVAAPAIMNPAVSFGKDFASALYGGPFVRWIYWTIAELLGGALAGGLFHFTHAHEFESVKA